MRSLRESDFVLGTGALLASAIILVNCARTPKFIDANQPAPSAGAGANSPSGPTQKDDPSKTPKTSILSTPAAPPTNAPSTPPTEASLLVGTWASDCGATDSYSSDASLASFKNVQVSFTFGSDNTYKKNVVPYANLCSDAASASIVEQGCYQVGATISAANASLLLGGSKITLTPSPGLSSSSSGSGSGSDAGTPASCATATTQTNTEYTAFYVDPNHPATLLIGPPGNTDPSVLPLDGYSKVIFQKALPAKP